MKMYLGLPGGVAQKITGKISNTVDSSMGCSSYYCPNPTRCRVRDDNTSTTNKTMLVSEEIPFGDFSTIQTHLT